jgi:hypothetical protein
MCPVGRVNQLRGDAYPAALRIEPSRTADTGARGPPVSHRRRLIIGAGCTHGRRAPPSTIGPHRIRHTAKNEAHDFRLAFDDDELAVSRIID